MYLVHIIANLDFILVLVNIFTKAMANAPKQPTITESVLPDITQVAAVVPSIPQFDYHQ